MSARKKTADVPDQMAALEESLQAAKTRPDLRPWPEVRAERVVTPEQEAEVAEGAAAVVAESGAGEAVPALVEYVVQRLIPDGGKGVWQDIATVSVPPRTKRSVVIRRALAEAEITPGAVASEPPLRLRALDVASAEALSFGPKPPAPPEWTVLAT